MEYKSVGAVELINGILDGQQLDIFTMKYTHYFIMLMSSYSTMEEDSPIYHHVKYAVIGKKYAISFW